VVAYFASRKQLWTLFAFEAWYGGYLAA